MNYIGDFSEDSTIRIALTTNNTSGAAVAPSTAFEADDFRIYKNGSATQKTTTNGITCTSPFDSVTGLHTLEIDTSNDTGDSGFWTTAADYWVVAVPDETVASQTVVQVIAAFSIENRYMRGTNGANTTTPPTAAVVADAVWDEATVDHTSTGSFGAAVGALPLAPAIADAVWDEPYSQHTTAGTFGKLMDILRKSNLTIEGTVSNAITPTTLTFSSDVNATTSAYAHAVLLFVSGPLAGENSPIVSYTSTNGVFVLEEPLTAAPSDGDEFVVIAGSHVHAIADIAAGVLASLNGSGARTVTITVDDGTNPLQNALVRVTNGGETYVVGTNVSGVAVFNLNDETWVVSITKPGYTFAGASLVVDGTETVTYSMSLVVITPSSPSLVTGYWTVLDENGSAAASVVVTIKARQPLRGGVGVIHDAGERTATSNGSGLVQFTNLIPGWRYAVVANDDYVADFVVPADAVTSVELGSIVARLP